MRILLTDGHQRSALAATRSLGRAGIEVYVGETAWKNVKDATIDEMYVAKLHNFLYWDEFSKLKEEVEKLPE